MKRIASIEKVMNEKRIFEKATVNGMLKEINRILIYLTYMEIEFSSSKMLGVGGDGIVEDFQKMKIEFGMSFRGMQQRIVRLRKQGRIRFVGKAGKGYWEVLDT